MCAKEAALDDFSGDIFVVTKSRLDSRFLARHSDERRYSPHILFLRHSLVFPPQDPHLVAMVRVSVLVSNNMISSAVFVTELGPSKQNDCLVSEYYKCN